MTWNKISHLGNDNGEHHLLPGFRHHEVHEEPSSQEAPANLHDESDGAKALIGAAADGKGERNVWFDPDLPSLRLSNEHMSITGESGSGKTQVMKTIIADLHDNYGIHALVLDFKDDYAEPTYAGQEGFTVYDPTKQALPLNPLAPPADPTSGQVNTTFHSYQLAEIISRIYRLGDLQGYNLRQAILEVYKDAGIAPGPFTPEPNQVWPLFQAVKDKLTGNKDNAELLGHMSPMFDFGFFSGNASADFGDIVKDNTVIRLGQLPGNEVKNSIAEFFLMALYNHLIRQPQTHSLSGVLILDEAWRLVNSPFLEPLMREGRAFGLGIFVATQFPSDLPLTVSGSCASQLFFSQSAPQEVTEIERIISGQTHGPEADWVGGVVRSLPPLSCVLHNKQYAPFVKVAANPYFKRYEASHPTIDDGTDIRRASGKDNLNLSKHAQNDGEPSYICRKCHDTTDNEDHICNACKLMYDTFDNTPEDHNNSDDFGVEEAVGDPEFPWQKAAELQAFPPGREKEDGGPFDILDERFVESPRIKKPHHQT